MRKHIKNLTSGLVIVALSALIVIWMIGAVRVFADIPTESGYTAILDFFAALVGILVGLVTMYGIGLKYNKLTATAKAEEDTKEAERKTLVHVQEIGFNSAFGDGYTDTTEGVEGEDNG